VILYEYPFNERIRTYLRLEHLFRRLGELIPRDHPLDHHYALAGLRWGVVVVVLYAAALLLRAALKPVRTVPPAAETA